MILYSDSRWTNDPSNKWPFSLSWFEYALNFILWYPNTNGVLVPYGTNFYRILGNLSVFTNRLDRQGVDGRSEFLKYILYLGCIYVYSFCVVFNFFGKRFIYKKEKPENAFLDTRLSYFQHLTLGKQILAHIWSIKEWKFW